MTRHAGGRVGEGPDAVPLDWLDAVFARLVREHRDGLLPHGLMLAGPNGIGKRALARALTDAWLCQAPAADGEAADSRPCGRCRACALSRAGTHPDRHPLEPDEGRTSISVDRVRDLSATLALHAHAGGSRVAVIVPAEAMTVNAQNSLLKTLEEPSPGTILVLVTDRPQALAATIRSRCRIVRVPAPTPAQALRWLRATQPGEEDGRLAAALALADGAPLLARDLLEEDFVADAERLARDLGEVARGRAEPVAVAERWDKVSPGPLLAWWQRALCSLARARLAGPGATAAAAESGTAAGQAGAAGAAGAAGTAGASHGLADTLGPAVDLYRLFDLTDRLAEARVAVTGGALNTRLLLESLLIDWAAATRAARARRSRR